MTELTTIADLEAAFAASDAEPIFIFKHSTTCPISGGAAKRVKGFLETAGEDKLPKFYYVKVIESRPVSNAIADAMKVSHESPQILLVDHGKAVWNTSHGGITADSITKAIETHIRSNAEADK